MSTDSLRRPVRRVIADPDQPLAEGKWPATIPAVVDLMGHGLDLGAVTVLVGDNGSGKYLIAARLAGDTAAASISVTYSASQRY